MAQFQLLSSSFTALKPGKIQQRPIQVFNPKKQQFKISQKQQLSKTLKVKAAEGLDYTPSPPIVGEVAPSFKATAVYEQEFVDIDSANYRGKYLVVFFYPLDFTFVCPTEITAFSDKFDEFKKLNAEVLGVSVDSQYSHLAWTQTDREEGGVGELKYPLVSDLTKELAMSFGVLNEDDGVALRGLFIIDKEGVIQHSTINNAPIGRNVEEVLRTLQAVKYVTENPDQVCPAGWSPGAESMSPTPKGSKEFFKKL